MTLLVIGISSLSANAMGHKHQYHNANANHQGLDGEDSQHIKLKNRLHNLAKKLDLTREQRSEIKQIFAGMRESRQVHKSALSGFKTQVQSMLQMSEFDEQQFATIYTEYQPSLQKAAMEKAKIRHAVMQVLTPEQQQKFLTMQKHH